MRAHESQFGLTDQVTRLSAERQGEDEHVTLRQQRRKLAEIVEALRDGPGGIAGAGRGPAIKSGRTARAPGSQHAYPEGGGQTGDFASDGPIAEDAKRFAAQFSGGERKLFGHLRPVSFTLETRGLGKTVS